MPATPVETQLFTSDAVANDNYPGRLNGTRHVVHIDDLPIEGGLGPQYGGATWRTMICRDRMESSELVLGVAQIPGGGVLAAHRHPPAECYFVLSGSGAVTIDGVPHDVIRGSSVYIPGNAEHSFAAGHDGVSFAYGFARHAFGEIEYSFSEC